MSVAPNIEELLDWLESESYAAREGIGLRSDYEDSRLAILAHVAGLERERDEARNCIAEAYAVADVANDERYAAWADRDRYKADAERWQYVRQFDCVEIAYGEVVDLSVGSETDAGPRNDTAIDAARAMGAVK